MPDNRPVPVTNHRLLAWMDVESTGDEPDALVLESSLIITDPVWPFNERSRTQVIVRPPVPFAGRIRKEEVLEMHARNGLLADVYDRGITYDEAVEILVAALAQHGRPHDFAIAGSGVGHFDLGILNREMPKVAKWLRYYPVDVGAFRRCLVAFGVDWRRPEQASIEKAHRSMADILDHLDETRWYGQKLRDLLGLTGDVDLYSPEVLAQLALADNRVSPGTGLDPVELLAGLDETELPQGVLSAG